MKVIVYRAVTSGYERRGATRHTEEVIASITSRISRQSGRASGECSLVAASPISRARPVASGDRSDGFINTLILI